MGCRGTACLTMVFTMGCRGISAPALEHLSPSFFTDLGVCRVVSLTCSHSFPWLKFPHLKYRCTPWGGPKLEHFLKNCSPWRTPHRSRWMCPEGSCALWKAHAGTAAWQSCFSHIFSFFSLNCCPKMCRANCTTVLKTFVLTGHTSQVSEKPQGKLCRTMMKHCKKKMRKTLFWDT